MEKDTQTSSTKMLNGSQQQSTNTETLQLTPNSFQTFQPHLGLQPNQSRPSFDSHLENISRTKQILNPLSTKTLHNNPHNKSNPYNFYAQKTNETMPEFQGEFPDTSQDETEIYEESAQLMSESMNNESDQHSPYDDSNMQGKHFYSNGSSSPSAQNHELNNTQQNLDGSQYQSVYFLNQMLPVNSPEQNVDKTGRLKNKSYLNKPHKCFICQKAFSNKSHLTDHIRIHTGEKPFHCDLCGRSFNVKSNLLTHLRNHAGEKQFKCNYCDEAFDRKKSLEIHLKFHGKINFIPIFHLFLKAFIISFFFFF